MPVDLDNSDSARNTSEKYSRHCQSVTLWKPSGGYRECPPRVHGTLDMTAVSPTVKGWPKAIHSRTHGSLHETPVASKGRGETEVSLQGTHGSLHETPVASYKGETGVSLDIAPGVYMRLPGLVRTGVY